MAVNFNALKQVTVNIALMATVAGISSAPRRLGSVEGYLGKKNEVIYQSPKCRLHSGCVLFFGGDIQDYKENMLIHRDNKHYAKWDLESTAALLHDHFPDYSIMIIKPSKMTLMSFACYENFVEVNNFGAPTYKLDVDPLKHLSLLLQSIESVAESNCEQDIKTSCKSSTIKQTFSESPLVLIGFSKGCVVLNQFLYSFMALGNEPDQKLSSFLKNIKSMYWLEGGHSGTSSTWVTDKSVLKFFSSLKIEVHIHVTPYQIFCETRPRIGKEEKIFRESLCRMGVDLRRNLHFESETRSLEMHFRVLEVFARSV